MFSIVTANWNGAKILDKFLDGLLNQTYKGFTLYLIDNGSTDCSLEILENYLGLLKINITLLKENTGFSYANNVGINQAMNDENKYILTLNSDVVLDSFALEKAKDFIIHNNNELNNYQLTLINYYNKTIIDATGIKFNKFKLPVQTGFRQNIGKIDEYDEIDGPCAGAAIYSKKALFEVSRSGKYFDENIFAYYEDADLALRMHNLNKKTLLIKTSIAFHMHSFTSGRNSYFKYFNLAQSGKYYLKKHKIIIDFPYYIFWYLFSFFKIFLKLILTFRLSALRGYIGGHFAKIKSTKP